MHLLDKDLAAGALEGVKQKEKEYNKFIEEGQAKGKNPYTVERKEMEQAIKDFAISFKSFSDNFLNSLSIIACISGDSFLICSKACLVTFLAK